LRGVELRTKRLLLRPWRDSDLESMTAINSHPEVHEFVSRVPDRAATADLIAAARRHWEQHRFGFFAVEARVAPFAGELLGFCGVSHPTFIPEVADRTELGYRLARAAWGWGFATEAGIACRDDAFYRIGLPELISLIDPANARSARVAEKVGMTPGPPVRNPLTETDLTIWGLHAPGRDPA